MSKFHITYLFTLDNYIIYRFSANRDYALIYCKSTTFYDLIPFNQFLDFLKRGDYNV